MTKPVDVDVKAEEAPPLPPAAVDVENQRGGGVSNIMQRWRCEGILKRGCLAFRAFGLLFSLLAFIIMATNQHGDGQEFDDYDEYRYVLAIAILSALYTGLQTWRQIHEIYTREIFSRQNAAILDFIGDQIVAYLLLSAASAAVPLTNNMSRGANNIFTDSSASAISITTKNTRIAVGNYRRIQFHRQIPTDYRRII